MNAPTGLSMMTAWLLVSIPSLALLVIAAVALALAIILGGPRRPEPWPAMTAPFNALDLRDLPEPSFYAARDGAPLAYRHYPATASAKGSAVLIPGSAGHSSTLHALAKALGAVGFDVYALDMRGHGLSGTIGRIDYIGQLEDDLCDFLAAVSAPAPRMLVGFSSGGGFALRFAASRRGGFDRALLLAPFLGPDAPTVRADRGRWVGVGLPRAVAILGLNRLGIRVFNRLPVLAFALDDESRRTMTATYDFALAENFRPHAACAADIRAVELPMRVVVGSEDEIVHPDRLEDAFKGARLPVPVTVVPNMGHIGLVTAERGIAAVVAAA